MKKEYPPKPIINEDVADKAEALDTPIKKEKVLKDSLSMDVRVERTNDIFDKYDEMGVTVTDKMAKDLIKKEFGVTPQEFFGQGIKDGEIEYITKDVAVKLREYFKQEETNKGSVLKFLREKMFASRYAKAVALSIILTFKFGGASLAAEKQKSTPQIDDGKGKVKTETVKQINHEGGDGDKNTYKVTTEDLKNMVDKNTEKAVSIIHITQDFDVDKATISEHNVEGIKAAVHSYLDKVDSKNFDKFMGEEGTISTSSDERATKYGSDNKTLSLENNKHLSEDRGEALKKIVQEAVKEHDFSKAKLSKTQMEKKDNLAKNLKVVIPEKGYTKITELSKPNGEKYTDKEVEEMKKHDKPLYDKLMKECRYAKVDFKVESFKHLITLDQYDEWSAYCDHSPSTGPLAVYLAEQFKISSEGNADKAGEIFFFSNKIDSSIKTTASKAADNIKTMRSDGNMYEKVFTSLCSGLEKTAKSDLVKYKDGKELPKRVAYVITDEALQDFQKIKDAVKLADQTNTEVKIILQGKVFDIHYLNDKFDKVFEKTKTEILSKMISKTEEYKILQHDKLIAKARTVAKEVSLKTFRQIFNQFDLENEDDIVNKLITENYKIPPFQKAEKSRIEDYKLRQLITEKDNFYHIESALKVQQVEYGKSGVEYMKDKVVIIKTITNEKGEKVVLGLNEDKTMGKENIFIEL
ncbi:MAG: hypothetical protein NTV03_03250 [Candidatus Nomurabacteria bacterium]|nr:hypothetical protein [Candidatus Nomurabacteria bacterium]